VIVVGASVAVASAMLDLFGLKLAKLTIANYNQFAIAERHYSFDLHISSNTLRKTVAAKCRTCPPTVDPS
jgi:hypothetical protein